MSVGYSGTPLAKKLGIKSGLEIMAINEPQNYLDLLAPLPAEVAISSLTRPEIDLVHLFTNSRDELFTKLAECVRLVKQNGADLGFLVQEGIENVERDYRGHRSRSRVSAWPG